MSEELTIFEKLGGRYIEKDGLLYPVFNESTNNNKKIWAGKYGYMWLDYMRVSCPDRYRNLFRRGVLEIKAWEINEEAYEVLDIISGQYIQKEITEDCNSTIHMWKLREMARQVAEEIVLQEVVFKRY